MTDVHASIYSRKGETFPLSTIYAHTPKTPYTIRGLLDRTLYNSSSKVSQALEKYLAIG
jgi:hypothetical protein